MLGAMLSGGKLIDEGMYGCIFLPALECANKKKQGLDETQDTAPISKLILKDAAEAEYSISKLIHHIPLWKNYFVVSESICQPAAIQKEKELAACQILDGQKLAKFRILTMPYGGVPINLYRFNLKTFNFMGFVKHFMEAGALLNLFGVVNRDIHQGNILVDNNDVPRIIDFNLAIQVESNVKPDDLGHQYNYITGQEPPDSTLVNAIVYGYKPQSVIDSIINKKPVIKRINTILQVSPQEMRARLEYFYNQSKAVKAGNDVAWFKTYWRTVDSWAIGVNIVDLISKLILWPEFSLILRQVRPRLFPVLRRLCAVSPIDRIDCVQALNHLYPESFIIRKYSKAWLAKVGTGNIAAV